MITVAAVTRQESFLRALEPLFKSNQITVSGIFSSFQNVSKTLKFLSPDIILLDVNLDSYPFHYGFVEVTQLIKKEIPSAGIIAFANFYSESAVLEIKQLGIEGYIYRTMPDVESAIIQSIRSITSGSAFYPSDLGEQVRR